MGKSGQSNSLDFKEESFSRLGRGGIINNYPLLIIYQHLSPIRGEIDPSDSLLEIPGNLESLHRAHQSISQIQGLILGHLIIKFIMN